MVLTLILILLAIGLSLITFYYGGYYLSLQWVWLPFILVVAYFWGLFLVHALMMAFTGFFLKRSKRTEWPPNPFAMWVLSQTCYILFWLFNVRFHASGIGKVPDPKTKFMVVSNHLSGFDHVGLISLFAKHRMICVSKEQNAKVIAAGGWIRLAGYLTIVQGDMVSGAKMIETASDYLSNGVCSVCIAPEGTRNKDFPNPQMLPFHPGSFQMAYNSHCPIVVFAIQNTNCILKRFPLRSTDVYFDCVGVLEYDEYKDLTPAELAKKTQGMIAKRFEHKEARFYHLKPKKESKPEA